MLQAAPPSSSSSTGPLVVSLHAPAYTREARTVSSLPHAARADPRIAFRDLDHYHAAATMAQLPVSRRSSAGGLYRSLLKARERRFEVRFPPAGAAHEAPAGLGECIAR